MMEYLRKLSGFHLGFQYSSSRIQYFSSFISSLLFHISQKTYWALIMCKALYGCCLKYMHIRHQLPTHHLSSRMNKLLTCGAVPTGCGHQTLSSYQLTTPIFSEGRLYPVSHLLSVRVRPSFCELLCRVICVLWHTLILDQLYTLLQLLLLSFWGGKSKWLPWVAHEPFG